MARVCSDNLGDELEEKPPFEGGLEEERPSSRYRGQSF